MRLRKNLEIIKYVAKHNPILNRRPAAAGSADWFYFLHIPKTAGTSLMYSIYDTFHPGQVYPNAWDYYVTNKGAYLPIMKFRLNHEQLFTGEKLILAGHYRRWPIENMRAQKPKVICFLRNPADRIMSAIDYHRGKGRRYDGLTREEVMRSSIARESTVQVRHLGYDTEKNNTAGLFKNLNDIDAVCLTEEFPASIALINRLFHWDLKPGHKKNVQSRSAWSSSLIDEIESHCDLENELYARAKEKFMKTCSDLMIEV